MPLRTLKAYAKPLSDLAVGVPTLDQAQHFALAGRELNGMLCPVPGEMMHRTGRFVPNPWET